MGGAMDWVVGYGLGGGLWIGWWAMDWVVGSKTVIAATTHTQKDGTPKIVTKCPLPLSAINKVNRIVTELAVIFVTAEGLLLTEIAEGLSPSELQAITDAKLLIFPELRPIPR